MPSLSLTHTQAHTQSSMTAIKEGGESAGLKKQFEIFMGGPNSETLCTLPFKP